MTPERNHQRVPQLPADEEAPTPRAELVLALVPGTFRRPQASGRSKRGRPKQMSITSFVKALFRN